MASIRPPQTDQQETLLEFPCKFPVKVMGHGAENFVSLVTGIVLSHAEMFSGETVTTNASSTGKYLAVTVTIEARSKAQLDRIYQELTDCEQVLVAL